MSGWYLDGKEQLLARTIPAEAGVYALGVNEDYAYDATHTDFDVFEPYILLPEKQLANVTFVGGVLKADYTKWVAAGAGVLDRSLKLTGVVIYFKLDDSGALLAYIDSAAAGLPQSVGGVDVTAKWDERGILKL
jgi:hypothetical protein